MRIIHIADVHFGKKFSDDYGANFSRERQKDMEYAFMRLISLANSWQADLLLCAGDLIDGDGVSMDELLKINNMISKLSTAKFLTVCGNHDISKNSVFEKIKWCDKFILAPEGVSTINFKDVAVHTVSQGEHRQKAFNLAIEDIIDKKRKNILLTHFDPGDPVIYLHQLVKSEEFDYVALGHIHKRQHYMGKAFYPGSFQPLDKSETGAHGCLLIDTENFSKVVFKPIFDRQYINITIDVSMKSEEEILRAVVNEIDALGRENIFSITLSGQTDKEISADALAKELQKICFVKVFLDITPIIDIGAIYEENRNNILGEFIASFDDADSETEKEALLIGVKALLDSRSIK